MLLNTIRREMGLAFQGPISGAAYHRGTGCRGICPCQTLAPFNISLDIAKTFHLRDEMCTRLFLFLRAHPDDINGATG